MSRNFACRPPEERDGSWFGDRFYHTPACCHYETTAGALADGGVGPARSSAPPRQFREFESLKSSGLQFPFTEHDNRHQHECEGENLRGTYRKRRPCAVRPLHCDSEPAVFLDGADPPTGAERLQTVARQSYGAPPAAALRDSAADVMRGGRRRFRCQPRCPFLDGSCRHEPEPQRRCEPVSTGPPRADTE